MSNELSTKVSTDSIRPIRPPRDTDGQLKTSTKLERNVALDVRNDITVSGNDVPADSRFIQKVNSTSLSKAVSELTQFVQSISRDLEFTIDKDLNKTVITVYDAKTDEVIRQIPSEEAIALARHLSEQQNNVLLKLKA